MLFKNIIITKWLNYCYFKLFLHKLAFKNAHIIIQLKYDKIKFDLCHKSRLTKIKNEHTNYRLTCLLYEFCEREKNS